MPLPTDPPPTQGPAGTVPDGSTTTAESSSPHMVVYTILDRQSGEPLLDVDGTTLKWSSRHPTADAAQAHISDIRDTRRNPTGENPWAEAIRLARAPNGSLIVLHNNLQMEVVPIIQRDRLNKESVPHGDRYKFRNQPGTSPGDSSPGSNSGEHQNPDNPVSRRKTPVSRKGPGKKVSPKKATAKRGTNSKRSGPVRNSPKPKPPK